MEKSQVKYMKDDWQTWILDPPFFVGSIISNNYKTWLDETGLRSTFYQRTRGIGV